MKLALKLTAALVIGIVLVMSAYAYVQVRREVVLFEGDLQKDARLGRALRATAQAVWQADGEDRARGLIEEADDAVGEVAIRLVWLDVPSTDPRHAELSADERQALAGGEVVRVIRERAAGDVRRYTYLLLSVTGARPAALELSQSLERQLSFIRMSRFAIGLATTAIVAVCGLVALFLGFWFVARPIRLLRDKARRVGSGDLSGRLVLRQRDEIGVLADDINAMCERIVEGNRRIAAETEARIATVEQLRHADRLATVGRLASGVAHELGTPLSVVSARAGMIGESDVTLDEARENARVIAEQSDRMSQVIHQLLDFSRRREAKFAVTSLRRIVSRALELVSAVAERRGVTIDSRPVDDALPVRVDENQVQQALTNVLVNGIQAMPNGGRLTVRIGARHLRPPSDRAAAEDDYPFVAVEDEGNGIPRENLAHLFEPFFSTKSSGEGTGLGLAVARGIVTEHGGWIDVESEPGKGSRFTIYLPPSRDAQSGALGAVS